MTEFVSKMERRIEGVDLSEEIKRSQSEIVVYAPKFEGLDSLDNGNEHFLVFEAKNGDLLAMWTQSSYEGALDHRIMLARSLDDGLTWQPPIKIVGPDKPGEGHMASWGFPVVADTGRIYCIWNQYQGIDDTVHQFTGTFDVSYSDDHGLTWSDSVTLDMPRSPMDHPDASIPANWIVWQKPERDSKGRWLVGFTRWTSVPVRPVPPSDSWPNWDCACEMMRFDNIHEGPDPAELTITYPQLHAGQLRVPNPHNPEVSVAQEPSIVLLPDGRLFVTMRTFTGHIWYSVSEDDGDTWRQPEVLRHRDDGEPLLQPICCCPVYPLEDGRYILLYHNNNGYFEGSTPEQTWGNRRPAHLALGEYRPIAHQPIWFSAPRVFMDCGHVGLGPLQRKEIGVYTSFTDRNGRRVLWHPDRKFFLLGKVVTDEFLAPLSVPK